MWTEIDLEALQREACVEAGPRSAAQVEQIVVLARLNLYNRGLPCGAGPLRRHLHQQYGLRPLPSVRSIGRMLARNGLSHGRTGWYAGDLADQPQRQACPQDMERRCAILAQRVAP